jgi:transcriptional regulator with XRE-family HTH domain
MAESTNTIEGLAQLARIVREARGHRKIREFAKLAGLSHATISRIEKEDIASPSDTTFECLAEVTGKTFEELKAIARSQAPSPGKQVRVAEDVLPLVDELSDFEAARLAQIIVARLARMDVSMGTGATDSSSGLKLEINLMTPQQLGAILRSIGDRLADGG